LLFMSHPIEIDASHSGLHMARTEIPSPDDFAEALMEEWAPSSGAMINERRAMTEDAATLRLARSF
jgi:hypothetical protein